MRADQILVSKHLGGAGVVALRLADELRRRSRVSRVWIPGEGSAAREAGRLGLDVRVYDEVLNSGSPSRMRSAIAQLRLWRDLKAGAPGLVHVHSPHAYRRLLPSLLLSGARRVVHVHIDEEPEGLRWAFRHPPHLIVTCARCLVESVRQALPRTLRERQWIEAVPNAVDTARFTPRDGPAAKRRVGAPVAMPLALMLANLAPHKGQETAIRTAAILKQAGITLHVWFAGVERGGGTAYTDRLKAIIAELGVADRVRLLGQRDDADHLLGAADFLLLPSTQEGLPLSIVEAQATKVPVLAAPTAGIPEVVADGETGYLIAADDAQGYADRIKSLLDNPALAHQVAERAYARAIGESSLDVYCERIIGLYRELLDRSRGGLLGMRPRESQRAASCI
jgi:glycosyltransferase involved in cell wall biosynthesis